MSVCAGKREARRPGNDRKAKAHTIRFSCSFHRTVALPIATLTLVTLTGPDTAIDPRALAALARGHPRVEWGVLSSAERRESRYPDDAWVAAFLRECAGVHAAIHLCDRHVDAFIAGDAAIRAKAAAFERAQLNFSQRRTPKDVEALARAIAAYPGRIILQHNDENGELIDMLSRRADFDVLFDASSGRGMQPESWPAPLPRVRCGYAGGLGPANVADELPRIAAASGALPFWIDMASSLREPGTGAFSVAACERVLSEVARVAG